MDDMNAADGWGYKLGGLGSQLPRTLPWRIGSGDSGWFFPWVVRDLELV
jgi:hypothetical protein